MEVTYTIYRTNYEEKDLLNPNALMWRDLDIADIKYFHPKSSHHHPRTLVRIGYDEKNIYVLFEVNDQYVRSIFTKYNSKVHEDSCVEWFIQPLGASGYYNFEMNAGGTLHVNYIIDPERDENGKRKNIQPIPEKLANMITINSSLPRVVDPEIQTKKTWYLNMIIPFDFFKQLSKIDKINSSIWRGNLYKCGDKTSHPHWGCWSPVEKLNFHQPDLFGEFMFSGKSRMSI